MKEKLLQDKINELIALGGYGDYENFSDHMEKQDKLFKELKVLAMMNGTLKGRILQMPAADGYAVYVITRVNKNSVSTQWIDFCDGYSDWNLGRAKGNMALHIAQSLVDFDDMWKK